MNINEKIYSTGKEPLNPELLYFEEEIDQNENLLSFYISVLFDPDVVFGTNVNTFDNDDFLNVYAYYDLDSGIVIPELTVILAGQNQDKEYKYLLSQESIMVIEAKMQAQCRKELNRSLESIQAKYKLGLKYDICFDVASELSESDFLLLYAKRYHKKSFSCNILSRLSLRIEEAVHNINDPRFSIFDYLDGMQKKSLN